jgi:2-oxoglutarate ferredoxin oxidoreductase subunit alpha
METQLSLAITGAGGAGVISCGELLLQAWSRLGGRGLLRKAFGPQIRGGEAAALLKLCESENYTAASHYDILVAFDWANFSRFEDEIRVSPDSLVICEDEQAMPESLRQLGLTTLALPLSGLAAQAHPEGRINMLVTGILGRLLELPVDVLRELAIEKLSGKALAYQEAAIACIDQGYSQETMAGKPLPIVGLEAPWYLSGNQAAAYGALEAGVRFVAAYPITPASDVLEWMAGGLEQVGGQLLQAEDELAAINMVIGGAFGGVPSFTATSGPGLALMMESIGLAVASETPLCILNVMRGGPSTGIPTKSEQSDLNIALYGAHGDAPHLVLAPLNIADCVFTLGWAVRLAQYLQTVAIVLSDQLIGQSTAVVSAPRHCQWQAPPVNEEPGQNNDYLRYKLTESGLSAMASPGDSGRRYTADGLEHNEKGTPSAGQSDHLQQLDKRRRKLDYFSFGDDWGQCAGEGDIALLCFGSSSAAVDAAAQLLAGQGIQVRTVALRLLAPLQVEALLEALAGCRRAVVIEQNHGGQLYRYLRAECDFELTLSSCAIPGPVPLDPQSIADHVAGLE